MAAITLNPLRFPSLVSQFKTLFVRPRGKRHLPTTHALRQIFEHHPGSMVLVDAQLPDMPIVYANPAFERLTGYRTDEVTGRNPRFLQGNDLQQEGREIIRRALAAREACTVTLRNFRKDGTLFWSEVHIQPIYSLTGKLTHFAGMHTDVTARVEAETSLGQMKARYQQMFAEHSAVKLLIDPATGQIMQANAAAAAFYGYPRETLEAMHIQEINVSVPAGEIHDVLQRTAQREQSYYPFQHRLASGEIRDVDVYSSTVDMPDGRFLYSFIVDATSKRAAEMRYKALFEQSNDGVFIISLTGEFIQVNSRGGEMLGYAPDELVGRSIRDVVAEDQLSMSFSTLEKVTQGEKVASYERTLVTRDGRRIPVEINPGLVYDVSGKPAYVITITRDISERKRLEAELRANEYKFRSLVEQSHDGIAITDEAGLLIEWNASLTAMTGVPSSEVLGQPIWDVQMEMAEPHLRTPQVYEPVKASIQDTLKTGSAAWANVPREFTVMRRDGTRCIVQAVKFPIRTESGYRIGSVMRDMSERRQIEDSLRESEARMRSLLESQTAFVMRTDASTRYTYVNAAFASWLGYTPVEMSQLSAMESIAPEDHERVMAVIAECVATPGKAIQLEMTKLLRDGSRRQTVWEFVAVPGPQGEPREIQCMGFDITRQHDLEVALEHSEALYHAAIEGGLDAYYLLESVRDEAGALVDFRLAHINEHGVQEIGLPREMLIGRPVRDIIPADRFDIHHAWYRQVLETGEPQEMEYELRAGEGPSRWYYHQITRVNDGVAIMNRDITQRKDIETALRRSEEQLRVIVENIPIMIGIVGTGGTFEFSNSYWRERLGWTTEELAAHPDPMRLFYPDEAIYRNATEAIRQADQHWHDYETQTKSGTPITASWANVRLSDGRGIGFGQDISERKSIEEALRRSEEKLRFALEGTRAGTWEWDIVTGVTAFDARWAEMLGYTLEELEPYNLATWVGLTHPDDIMRSNALLAQYFMHEIDHFECETRMRHKDGHWVWVLSRGMVSPWDENGQPVRMYGTHLDITERKQMEDALRESETMYRLIAENTSDGIVTMDGSGKVIYASPSYDRQYGRKIGGTLGQGVDEIRERIHPDDRDMVFRTMRQALTQQTPSLIYTFRSRREDGSYFWREDHAQFEYAPDGTHVKSYIISRDITERKQNQEREIALEVEKERAKVLMRFFQDAAHEFRTPLSVINTHTYLIAQANDGERRLRHSQKIANEVKRIAQLVDMLLMMVRLESNEAMLNAGPMDVYGVVDAACRHCSTLYGRSIHVQWTIPPRLPQVFADPGFLLDALNQVLDNAGRYTAPSGTVTVGVSFTEDTLTISVCDTGEGISAEDLPHIFELFWRRDRAHSTPGFGLGLPIAKRIVERFGGEIRVESRLEQGSCFYIALPVIRPT